MNLQLRLLIQSELKKAFRTPSFSIPTILLPVSFYLIFGVMMSGNGNGSAYLLSTYIVFAAMAPGLFGIGITLANEKETGWVDVLNASPANPAFVLGARICMAVIFAFCSALLIILLAIFLTDIKLNFIDWSALLGIVLLATTPFACIGLMLGSHFSRGSASVVSNLLFLPMAVLSGLWFPLKVFPDFMQTIALFFPTYHVAQMSLNVVLPMKSLEWGLHLTVWAIWTVVPLLFLTLKQIPKRTLKLE